MLQTSVRPTPSPFHRTKQVQKKKSWQKDARKRTIFDEQRISDTLEAFFKGTEYTYIKSPRKMFKNFFMSGTLTDHDKEVMYTPEKGIRSLDMEPDGIIINNRTGKSILLEHKRQDGLTEGRASDKSSGNQYERVGRYMLPGVALKLRKICRLENKVTPFLMVVTGPVTKEERQIHILRTMFDAPGSENNLFLWRDGEPGRMLTEHIKVHILPFLE